MNDAWSIGIDGPRVAKRVLFAVLLIEAALLLGDLVFNYLDVFNHLSIRRIFNVAREQSIPTWFASLQALLVAATAWALWRVERFREGRRLGWLLTAVFFLYISVDDAAEIHERVATALRDTFPTLPLLADYPSFSWHVLIAPILAAGLFGVAAFLWFRLPTTRTRVLVFAGLAAFGIAQFFDLLEGVDGLFAGWAADLDVGEYTVSHSFRAIEETLEMLGTTAFWAPMLFHLANSVNIQVSERQRGPD